jgi:glycosyltransferase involved in cell wall biosynthesis
LLEKWELRMYRDAVRVVCLTRSFMDNLMRRGIPSHRLAFVPNGVDPEYWAAGDGRDAREALGLGPEQVLVSYIGTVGMAHGVGTVLECARMLKNTDPAVRFAVVGDGAELAALRARSHEEGLTNVTFTGLVPHERARDIMTATDISLVLLRRSSLFLTVLPSKMFEAMGAAKPMVLGVAGEAREALERAGAGIPVTPEDAGALAEAVRQLAGNQRLRKEMGEKGRSFVAREFNRRELAGRYLRLLMEWSRAPMSGQEEVNEDPVDRGLRVRNGMGRNARQAGSGFHGEEGRKTGEHGNRPRGGMAAAGVARRFRKRGLGTDPALNHPPRPAGTPGPNPRETKRV